MRRYDRIGTAGAFMFVGGAATTWAGRQTWEGNHQETGVAMMTTGAALQVTGLLMVIWALDGLILQPGGYDPARGNRPTLP